MPVRTGWDISGMTPRSVFCALLLETSFARACIVPNAYHDQSHPLLSPSCFTSSCKPKSELPLPWPLKNVQAKEVLGLARKQREPISDRLFSSTAQVANKVERHIYHVPAYLFMDESLFKLPQPNIGNAESSSHNNPILLPDHVSKGIFWRRFLLCTINCFHIS